MISREFDSPFIGDTDIKRLAQLALDAVPTAVEATRMPEDVGIDHVD